MTVAEAAEALARGQVVAFPTESSYGLGADAWSPAALERLGRLKARRGKPPPVLITARAMLEQLVARVPARAEELMARHWPGPLTLVLPARPGVPEALVEGNGVGVRHSPHPSATRLVAALGRPITATSCNPTDSPPAVYPGEVRGYFGDELALLEGAPWRGMPSTVVRVSDEGRLEVLRSGGLDPALL